MIGEFLNSIFNEVAGKDPATRRALGAPFMGLSALFDLSAIGAVTTATGAALDGPHASL